MPRATVLAVAFALVSFALAGCGPARLNETKTYTLEPGTAQSVLLDPQPKPQKINVEFSSTAAEVYVYFIKSQGKDEEVDVTPGKDITLASKNGKEGSFSVDVPENTRTRVIVRGANTKTDVTIKINNKP
jgi:hypothetical protein